jgi:hypothetical protein
MQGLGIVAGKVRRICALRPRYLAEAKHESIRLASQSVNCLDQRKTAQFAISRLSIPSRNLNISFGS